jgi:hypothetical protein
MLAGSPNRTSAVDRSCETKPALPALKMHWRLAVFVEVRALGNAGFNPNRRLARSGDDVDSARRSSIQ